MVKSQRGACGGESPPFTTAPQRRAESGLRRGSCARLPDIDAEPFGRSLPPTRAPPPSSDALLAGVAEASAPSARIPIPIPASPTLGCSSAAAPALSAQRPPPPPQSATAGVAWSASRREKEGITADAASPRGGRRWLPLSAV